MVLRGCGVFVVCGVEWVIEGGKDVLSVSSRRDAAVVKNWGGSWVCCGCGCWSGGVLVMLRFSIVYGVCGCYRDISYVISAAGNNGGETRQGLCRCWQADQEYPRQGC